MCLHCDALQISKSIFNQSDLEQILKLLKCKSNIGVINTTCLLTNRKVSDFEYFDWSQNHGLISLKFNCIHCDTEYRLFSDTSPSFIGFFNPLYNEKTTPVLKATSQKVS